MVKSMTGFGKTTVETGSKKMVIEIKSLNAKQFDMSLRMPNLFKDKEMEIRSMVKERLDRGKIEMNIYYDSTFEGEKNVAVNGDVVVKYFNQMLEVSGQLGFEPDKNELLQTVMRFPDTLQVKVDELGEDEWAILRRGIEKALDEIDGFRIQEGKALIKDILHRIELIQQYAAQVPQYETRRIEVVRQKLQEKLNEWTAIKNVDQNRLEQELIYYLEKLDITEEKVRLANHCKYFIETAEKEEATGRKLGFIAQEIGREINTMGSKANDLDIQKLVVMMKDELEKIKEQSLNVL
ncbi:MAG: YicC family protein [Odoribacter sp.]|nr:YicC family protein [Odoribacter sp.]